MKIVLNENTSLSFNMAAEEYMMKCFNDDIFMLWRAKRSVLIGKNQNALAEVNYDYVKENDIDVVRRLSGGGTVFCDLGNTNFAFIVTDKKSFSDFRKFTKPILEVLQKLGVNAEFSGRNDLTIEGKKFSGNAQYKYKDRLLHHGTLLFSSDLGDLTKSINPPKIKYESKGISSVKSRVTNIKAHLKDDIDIIKFRQLINQHILETVEDAEFYEFTDEDIKKIEEIENQRFKTWEWNYGNSPKYTSYRSNKFSGGVLEVYYEITKGKIAGVKMFGDFFSRFDVADIESALIDVTHEENAIKETLNQFNLDDYLKNITADEIISLFF
ncbi:lipoate--protein ligase [Acidaminobacter sp. JC074]|uniref:lipoate--protein ligase n=1 Tax=Acidaminobacter sp. JC074 TaxID=2530199 RepID=UPI001F0EFF1C|nr:lipoate--protein ligase [Acidaminobacter sp. JC074]MCH4888860.1 lipoate--protein ligase [Acidaminobacter sp. JC074]